MAAISALVHAALLRVQGSAGPMFVMGAIGALLPLVAKAGLRDDAVSQIVFALISASALCLAAYINHWTLTRSSSSASAYRQPRAPFGAPTAPRAT